jgi:hypothetical protein
MIREDLKPISAAHRLGACGSKERFGAKLKKIAKAKVKNEQYLLTIRALLPVFAVLLTGAVAAAQEQPRRTWGFETFVIVEPAADKESASRDANRHCAQYGRHANFRRMDGRKALFDCDIAKIEPHRSTGGIY